jgi:uncharacterized protein with NAD-binding domain and iron-sulfur cluster
MAKKRRTNFEIATNVFNEARGKPALIEDDVSLCSFILKLEGIDITLKRAEKIREEMVNIEHDEAVEDNKADVVVVLDCRTASPFNPEHVKAFKNNSRGRELAEETFREWVKEQDVNDEMTDTQMDAIVNDGVYELGEGFIAMIETNC